MRAAEWWIGWGQRIPILFFYAFGVEGRCVVLCDRRCFLVRPLTFQGVPVLWDFLQYAANSSYVTGPFIDG
jgi:hypothetical protein